MAKFTFKNAEGDHEDFDTLKEAKAAYKKYIGSGEGGWTEDTVNNCRIHKLGYTICKPVMIDKVLVEDMPKHCDVKDMCESEGWAYTCDYEMQEVAA